MPTTAAAVTAPTAPQDTRRGLAAAESGVVNFVRNTADATVSVRPAARYRTATEGSAVFLRTAAGWTSLKMNQPGHRGLATAIPALEYGTRVTALGFLTVPPATVSRIGARSLPGGVAATEYRIVLSRAGGAQPPMYLWIDGHDRIRQVQLTLRQPAAGAAHPAYTGVSVTMRLSGFGPQKVAGPSHK